MAESAKFFRIDVDFLPIYPSIRMIGLVVRRGAWVELEPETVLKALADRTRQRALALVSRHELSVSELVELLHQPQSTVSRHLKVLREAGLIHDRRDGTTVLYSAPAPGNGQVGAGLSERLLGWVAEQPLAPAMRTRLQAVIDRRREASDEFFGSVVRHWDVLREENFGPRFHLEAMIALLPAEWTVADIGTGTGYFLPALAGHFKRVIGVDPVEAMLEAAHRRAGEHDLDNVELRIGDLSHLPIKEGTIDLALALLVLHHVPSPQDAVAELCRIVTVGGRVLIVEQLAHRNEDFRNRMQDRWWGFEAEALSAMVSSAGFHGVNARVMSCEDLAPDVPELFVVTGLKMPDGHVEAEPPDTK